MTVTSYVRNNLGIMIARAPPGRLGATPGLGPRPRGKEDNKSLENKVGSGYRARPVALCSFALSALSLPLSVPAALQVKLRLQFGLRIRGCQSFSNRRSFSLFRNSFFSVFSSFFFFIVTEKGICLCAPPSVCPGRGRRFRVLDKFATKKSMFKIWPPPAATVGMVYISASLCITSRRVNVYKETVGRFGGFKAAI